MTIADSPSLNLTSGMTLEAWVKPAALAGSRDVLLKERPSGLSYALYATDPHDAGAPPTHSRPRQPQPGRRDYGGAGT